MPRHIRGSRRHHKSSERRVRVFSEPNRNLRAGQIAHLITNAGLERARLEAEAQAEDATRCAAAAGHGEDAGHA